MASDRFTAAPVNYRVDPLPMAPLDAASLDFGPAVTPQIAAPLASVPVQPSVLPDVPALSAARSLLNPNANPATQRLDAVASAADEKRLALGGAPAPETFRNAAIARRTGSGVASSNGIEQDLATLSYEGIREKYGHEVGDDLIRGLISAENRYQHQSTGSRTTENILSDAVSGAGLGFANSVGGMAGLAAGAVSDDAGVAIANGLQSLNEAVRATQSPALQNRRLAAQSRNALDYRDNRQTFEQERATQGDFVAGLRRFGRDFLDAAGNTLGDGVLTADTIGEGAGSLLAAGPVGRALRGTAQAVFPHATARELVQSAGSAANARAIANASRVLPGSTTIGIGAMEAGGAHQQTASEIAGMDHADLLANSSYYRDLVQDGMDPEQARIQAANRAGLAAAAITAPAAMAAGSLVSRFEAAPFRVPNVRGALGNLGRETLEETTQSATGELAGNIAVQRYGDASRLLSEGVGEQAALGAIGGFGAAGVTQAPGIAGRSALAGVSAAGRATLAGLGMTGNALSARAEKLRERNEQASPIGDAQIQQAASEATAQAPAAEATLREAVVQSGAAPEIQERTNKVIDNLMGAVRFDEATDLADPNMPGSIKSLLSGSTNWVEAMTRLAQRVVDPQDIGESDRLSMAAFLQHLQDQFETVAWADPEALRALPKDHPAVQLVQQYGNLVVRALQNPTIRRGTAAAQKTLNGAAATPAAPITAETLATPEGQQAAQIAVGVATAAPTKAKLETVETILTHAEAGRLRLTEGQKTALLATRALLNAAQATSQEQDAQGHKTRLNLVGREIKVGPDPKARKLSAEAHAQRIVQAMRAGNTELAQDYLTQLGQLVRHFQNKVGALNSQFEQGQKPSYKALNPDTRKWYDSDDLPKIHYGSAGSIELAQSIALEGKFLSDVYNGLSTAFPALGGRQTTPVSLNPMLQGPIQQVADAFKAGERKAGPIQKTEITPTEKPPAAAVTEAVPPSKTVQQPPQAAEAPTRKAETATEAAADKNQENLVSIIRDIADKQLAAASSRAPNNISSALVSELGDVAILLDLLGIPYRKQAVSVAPSEREILLAQKKLLQVYTAVLADPDSFDSYKNDLADVLKWFAHASNQEEASDRRDRAERHAQKYGAGNVTAHYLIQAVEELSEVLAEQSLPGESAASKVLEIQKRALKALRFGANTVNKGRGPYEGKTNLEALGLAQAAAATETTSASASEAKATTEAAAQDAKQTDAKPELKGMDAAFPNLVGTTSGSKVVNFFKRAFRLPETQISRLTGTESPLAELSGAFANASALAAFTGNDANLAAPREALKAVRAYLAEAQGMLRGLDARLQAFLGKDNILARFRNGEEVNRWIEGGKILNLTEQDGKTLRYNPQLVESAVLAGLQWLLTLNQQAGHFDGQAIAGLTGLSVEEAENLVDEFEGRGLTATMAKQALARKIRQFWGLESNPEEVAGHVEGIPETMAAEILEVLVESGGLLVDSHKVEETGKDIDFYKANPAILQDNPELNRSLSAIERAVLIEPEDINYFGEARPKVAKTQLRSPAVFNTSEQLEMIEKAQDTKHRLDLPMVRLYQALTREGLAKLFGVETANRPLNKNHEKSLTGRQRGLLGAYDQLMAVLAEATDAAAAMNDGKGIPLDQLPIHFRYNVTRVGRLQMLGRYASQASKLMREAVLPTQATLDLGQRSGRDYERFMLGMAQALGQKVHKQTLATSIAETEKMLAEGGTLAEAVDLLRGFHESGQLGDNTIAALKQGLGKKLSFVALHALSEYARLQEMTLAQRASFTTSIYVEADGVTNGPVNAMMLLSYGRITAEWVARMAKGGLFFRGHSGGPTTMNEQHTQHDSVDLYETTMQAFDRLFTGFEREISSNPQLKEQLGHLKQLMNLFLDDFSLTKDEKGNDVIQLNRSITKNPLTITLYGSGAMGIAGNVAGAMLENIYERMSQAAERRVADPKIPLAQALFADEKTDGAAAEAKFATFQAAWNHLTTTKMGSSKDGLYVTRGDDVLASGELGASTNPTSFTADKKRMKNLRTSVRHLFISPLRDAIEDTVGSPLMQATKLLQQATQIQSLFQERFFLQAYQAKLLDRVAKDPQIQALKLSRDDLAEILAATGLTKEATEALLKAKGITREILRLIQRTRAEGLSQRDTDAVLKETIKKFPMIDTGRQRFFVGGSQSTEVNSTAYSRSLTGGFRSAGYVYGPTDAGVSGIPFMVIGSGDGQAIQSLATGKNAPEGALYIFDGVHFRLTDIEAYSRLANQAIHESWMGNPLQAVQDSYQKALPNFDLTGMPEELQEKIARTLGLREFTSETLSRSIARLQDQLGNAALSVEARHRAVARVSHHIDQMAAASSPYHHQGIELQGSSNEEIANELEALAQEELAKLRAERKIQPAAMTEAAPTPAPAPTGSEQPTAKPLSLGQKLKSGVRRLGPGSIRKLLTNKQLPANQRMVLKEILRANTLKDFTIVTGTAEQITAFQDETGRPVTVPTQNGKVHGWINFADNTIYLPSASSESLTHELVHASTFETVLAHYEGKDLGERHEEVAEAIQRLELLMEQFLDFDLAGAPESFIHASAAIRGYLNQGNKAAALNEYMAWGLANKQLAQQQAKTGADRLANLMAKTLDAIRQLIWGRKAMPRPAMDMFSNLLFNSAIIMQVQPTLQQRLQDTTLFMSQAYGNDPRLSQINTTFDRQVGMYLNAHPEDRAGRLEKQNKISLALAAARHHSGLAKNLFPSTAQEITTFESVVAALATEAAIDPSALTEAQALFAHVTKALEVEHLMTDPKSQDPNVRDHAQNQLNFILGNYGITKDEQGRSSLIPVFLALAMVSPTLRTALAKLPLPKTALVGWNSLDGIIENAGSLVMEKLSRHLSGDRKAHNISQAIDALSARIQEVAQDRQTLVDQLGTVPGGIVDRANQGLVQGVNALARAAVRKTGEIAARNPNKLSARALASSAKVFEGIVNEDKADVVAQGVVTAMNNTKGWTPFTKFATDLVGRTEGNKGVYDLIKFVRSRVQQTRQQFREHLPTTIDKKFTRKLTDAEWSTLFRGLGKTDLAAVAAQLGRAQALELLTDARKLSQQIQSLESSLQGQDSAHWSLVLRKAKQLATYMTTGAYGSNLLSNAEAVALLLNERTQRNRARPGASYISELDQLISLYALQGVSQQDRDALSTLVQDQKTGMDFALAYLMGQRAEEMRKAEQGRARLNHFKGHIPSLPQDGVHMIVADDAQYADLIERSYVRVGNYEGSAAEIGGQVSRGYYVAPVSARAPYNQGIMQNVKLTASGVEASTGFTDGLTAGRIGNPALVRRITQAIAQGREGNTSENLRPVFDESGEVVAYERGVDPSRLQHLNADTHLARMIGVWRGRQVEEAEAWKFNTMLVDALHAMWQRDMGSSTANRSQYVNLFDASQLDPVQQDAVALLSGEIGMYAASKFGPNEFWVRRDMFDDALGYRRASLGDAWTGNTRWSPEIQRGVKHLAMLAMGNDAYRLVLNREQDLQDLVKTARQLIVVKSVVVPVANFVSNIYHLIGRGVPMARILKDMPRKLVEVNAYAQSKLRQIDLEAELRAAEGDVVRTRELTAEIQSIEDSHRRMTIWPLIEAGEFSSISDAGISRDDLLVTGGKLQQFIERQVAKLPQSVQSAGRYALITKDTALFQGLQKSVEYGDFLAKAILYDDLTKRQKKTKEQALGRITEEFVNYDRLPGRFRGYVEDVGLLWFYNFKIRSVKVALSVIRNNPVHALLAGLLPDPPGMGAVGTALEDNLLTKGLEGTLGWSIGPGMGFRAPSLNPWSQLLH